MKSQIKNMEINVLMWFLMSSGVIGITFNTLISVAKQDACIAPIIGIIIGFVPLIIFIRLMNYKNDSNINDILYEQFGIFGKIISLFICGMISFYIIVNFYNLTNFISSEYLYSTPKFFIAIMFVIPILYALIHPFQTFTRSIIIFGYISFFLFIVGLIGLSIQTMPENIMPLLVNGIGPSIHASFYDVCYITLPLFLLTIIPKKDIRNNEKLTKRMIITYLLSSFVVCTITYVVLSVFGIELSLLYQYPTYNILKRISLLSIFDRIESIVAIMWILFLYVTCTMGCYYIKKTFFQVFSWQEGKVTNGIIFIILCVILFTSIFIFPNNTFVNHMLLSFYPVLLSVFFFFIPCFLLIIIKIRKKQ